MRRSILRRGCCAGPTQSDVNNPRGPRHTDTSLVITSLLCQPHENVDSPGNRVKHFYSLEVNMLGRYNGRVASFTVPKTWVRP